MLEDIETIIGVDNGNTSVPCFYNIRTKEITFAEIPLIEIGKQKYIDDLGFRDLIMAHPKPFVVWEDANVQPAWSSKNNFLNGANAATVRVVLRQNKIPSRAVIARTWQAALFRDMRGFASVRDVVQEPSDKPKKALEPTKALAIEFCRNVYPHVSLRGGPRCKVDDPAYADGLCLMHYGRSLVFQNQLP